MSDTKFAEGFYFDDPRQAAPDWVVGKMSVQVAKAVAFLQANANEKGYVNLDIKRGKNGKPYVALDTWKPKAEFSDPSGGAIHRKAEPDPVDESVKDDLPF